MIVGLFVLSFLLFPLGQIGRLSFFDQTINGYLYEIPLGIALLGVLFSKNVRPKWAQVKRHTFTLFFIATLILSFGVSYLSHTLFSNALAFLYILRLLLYVVFFFIVSSYMSDEKNYVVLKKTLNITITLIAVVSLAQFMLYPDLRNLFYAGWDEHLGRVFGTFLDTSIAASVYGIILIYLITDVMREKKNRMRFIVLTFIYIFLCLFTYSRGLYVSLIITIIAMLLARKYYMYAFFASVVSILAIGLVYKPRSEATNLLRTRSIYARVSDNTQAMQLWQQHPLVGIGYNRIREYKKVPPSDILIPNHAASSFSSSFVTVLVTSGAIGLLGFIGFLWEMAQVSQEAKWYVVLASVMSLFDNILLHPFVLFMLFSSLALSSRVVLKASRT